MFNSLLATDSNLGIPTWALILLLLWVLPWKAVALWRAVKNHQKGWFVALLILNTLAILEITYIFYFGKKSQVPTTNSKSNPND